MNKQLFEEMVQKVIAEAKEAMHKMGQKQPGGDTSGDRPVLDSQISSESITIGAVAQQVQNVHDINFYRLFCFFVFYFYYFYHGSKESALFAPL